MIILNQETMKISKTSATLMALMILGFGLHEVEPQLITSVLALLAFSILREAWRAFLLALLVSVFTVALVGERGRVSVES